MKARRFGLCGARRQASFLQALSIGLFGLLPLSASANPDATVTPSTLSTTSLQSCEFYVTGAPTGGTCRIERIVDTNGNGAFDAGDYLVESHLIVDGVLPTIGGVRNVNVPGDEDGVANGEIRFRFRPLAGAEIGRLAGPQLLRVSSPSDAFAPIVRTFSLTNPTHAQTISGTVRSGAVPVPHAAVVFLQPRGEDIDFIGGVVADADGHYSFTAPSGNYILLPVKQGYVASLAEPTFVSLAPSAAESADPELLAATRTISGSVMDANGGAPLGGVQLFVDSENGGVLVASTASDGTFSIPVTDDQWGLEVSEASLGRLGYVAPDDSLSAFADTRTASVSGVTIALTKGTALIHGTITGGGAPLAGIEIGASNSGTLLGVGISYEDGSYALAVTADQWNIWFDDENPILQQYLPPPHTPFTVTAGQALLRNFALSPVTAHLQGNVTKNGNPFAGARIGAYRQSTNTFVQVTTGDDGAFNLAVAAGTWTLQLESQWAAAQNVIGPARSFTLTDGQTVTSIAVPLLDTTAQINGSVRDDNNQPVNGNAFAFTTVNNLTYSANTPLVGGNYSLAVAAGTWTVGVSPAGFPSPASISVTVTSGSVTRNFTVTNRPTIISHPQPQTVNAGNSFNFSVSVSSQLSLSYQWQVSTDSGETWQNLSNDATYNNVTSVTLTGTASLGLNGYRYRCVVTNSAGEATSNSALLTVQSPNVAPFFTQHPFDAIADVGTTATFQVAVTGTPTPALQWQVSTDAVNWTNLTNGAGYSGTTTPMLSVLNVSLAQSGTFYRAVAQNTAGTQNSGSARLEVRESFSSWQQQHFTAPQLSDPLVSGPNATPAGDGLTNLFKYAFDLDPFTPGGGRPLPSPIADAGTLTLSFEALRDDVHYTVEASTNLTTWSSAGVQLLSEGRWREARVALSGPAVFLRIVVTTPPPS